MMNQFNQKPTQTYLFDESNLTGRSSGICFPLNNEEVAQAIKEAKSLKLDFVIQGSRTGLVAGALPFDSLILNLTKLNNFISFDFDPITYSATLTIQAGVTLKEITSFLSKREDSPLFIDPSANQAYQNYRNTSASLFFSINPTEDTATIGGILASRATGSTRLAYGDLRNHLSSITVVFSNGTVRTLRKTDPFPEDFPQLVDPLSSPLEAGYHTDASFMDLFIGSEGTLGIISEVTLDLHLKAPIKYGILAFFNTLSQAKQFCECLSFNELPVIWAAEEFFDQSCFHLLQEHQDDNKRNIRIPDQSDHPWDTALWIQLHGDNEEDLLSAFELVIKTLDEVKAPVDLALSATDQREFELLGSLKHQLTEANQSNKEARFIADILVPEPDFLDVFESLLTYCHTHKLKYTLHGSIHEYKILFSATKTTQQDNEWFTHCLKSLHARCACDYGIGIIKKSLFRTLHQQDLKAMSLIKDHLDPDHLFSKSLFFEDQS